MVKRRFLSTRMLENGMVIDQSIIDKSGRILVARKTVLDDYMIDALRKMKMSGVYIREGEEEIVESGVEASPETSVASELPSEPSTGAASVLPSTAPTGSVVVSSSLSLPLQAAKAKTMARARIKARIFFMSFTPFPFDEHVFQ